MTNCTPQVPSFPCLRHPRRIRKVLSRRVCPSASGRHRLALCIGLLKRVLTASFDECLLRRWAGLGIHPAFGDLSVVPKSDISHRPDCAVGVWTRELGSGYTHGVRDAVRDVVYKATVLIISEVVVLLLRDVNNCRRMVEPGSQQVRAWNLPSSSCSMWSSPTFCPLACFALAPQTIALRRSISDRLPIAKNASENRQLTISFVSLSPYEWHCKNLEQYTSPDAKLLGPCSPEQPHAAWCRHGRGRGLATFSQLAHRH